MKKRMFAIAMILGFIWGALAFAQDERCPLTGNVYVFEAGDIEFELSGFECTFGPGCQAVCDLWHGNFDTGPLYHARLPFICEESGDVLIANIPFGLTAAGNLECLPFVTTNYKCQKIGTKTWCVPKETGELLLFKKIE